MTARFGRDGRAVASGHPQFAANAVVEFRCPCGNEWQAAAFRETGVLFLVNDDKSRCPICGQEGERIV